MSIDTPQFYHTKIPRTGYYCLRYYHTTSNLPVTVGVSEEIL